MISKMDRILLSGLARITSWRQSILSWGQSEEGVVGFEYLLVIGGVSVAVVIAIALGATPITNAIKTGTCKAVSTITGYSAVAC